jgi:hypothetical protein
MGSYTDFKIGEYTLLSNKSDVIPPLMTLFRESDRLTLPSEEKQGEDSYDTHLYRTSVRVAKDRLGVMGFSLNKTQQDFLECKADEESRLQDWSEDLGSEDLRQDLEILRSATFGAYVDGFRQIKNRALRASHFGEETAQGASGFVRFMLAPDDDGYLFQFPCSDLRYLVRAFLEVCGDDETVSQDLTELISAGYYEPNDHVCELAISALTEGYPVNSRIIVLTEGSSDKHVLESAIDLLYPHLTGFYSFMDFASSNAAGGTGALVSNVRAFSGSGITNRVVALFDNDTAGLDAVRVLKKTALPLNIKIVHYPDSAIGISYPTIGPTGMVNLNVNGLAASIELFLGLDVLTTNGELSPVQWTGYNTAVGRYQGEILNKTQLHDRFFEKVSICKSDQTQIERYDFADMRCLLENLFQVFQ